MPPLSTDWFNWLCCYSGASAGVVLTHLHPAGHAAAADTLPLPSSANDAPQKHVATGNQARVFNAYDVIADLPPPLVTMTTVANGDDYQRPSSDYWRDDSCYETVNILDDQDDDQIHYYNYY